MNHDVETELGTLPESWHVRRLDSVFAIQQGKQVAKASQANGEVRPFLRTRNVLWGRTDLDELDEMTFTAEDEVRLALLPDDLLICEGGDIGRTGIWRGERVRCYYQNHLHRARAIRRAEIDPLFALYWLWYAFGVGRVYFGRGNVTTIPNLSKSRLGELPMPVPSSLAEQQGIARALRLVEDAIAVRESVAGRTRELKDAALAHLLSRDADEEAPPEVQRTATPGRWEVVRLGEVCRLSTGTTPATSRPDYYMGDVPLIKTTEIANNRIASAQTHISDEAVADCNLRKYPSGAILMAMYGQGKTRGQVSLLEITATTTQNAAAIECGDEMDPEFVWHFLLSRYQHLREAGALGHISHLNLGDVADLLLPAPPLADQHTIVAVLNSIDARLELAKLEIALLRELFSALLTGVMTARVRVATTDNAAHPAKVAR
jgi:type I restriction enzyme S subunit